MGIQINGNTNNINAGIGSLSIEDLNELDIVGVATASNFKTGSSNLHSTGLTVGNNFLHSTGINVGTGATIHVPSSNVLTLGTNSNERIRIKSDGYVGVNETNPQYPLHVSGATTDPSPDGTGILMGLQHEYAAIHLNAADTKGCLIDFSVPNTDRKGGILYYHSNNPTTGNRDAMLFYTNGQNERLRITSDGKVGINQSTPTAELEVVPIGTGTTSTIFIHAPTHNTNVASEAILKFGYGHSGSPDAVGHIKLAENGGNNFDGDFIFSLPTNNSAGGSVTNERFSIKYNGQVSISSDGTTDGLLTIKGDSDQVGTPSIRLLDGSDTREVSISNTSGDFVASVHGNDNAIHGHIKMFESGIIDFNNGGATGSNVNRLRIDSSGRVVVGGTSAYIGGAALAVMGTGTTPNTYGSFAIGKIGANPTANTTLANIRLNGGSIGTRRGAEINAIANGNWSDGSSHPTKLTFAVANENSASATQRFEINHYGHHVFTNENVFPSSGSPGTNGFKGLTQLGYQHWGWRQYYSGQQNKTQNQYFDLFSNNTAHDDIIFWLNIKGFHANRTFATAHGAIGGYGLSVSYQSASGVYGSFSATNIGSGRNALRWTSTSPYGANWWIWGWYSGTTGTGTHTGHSAAQLH